MVDQCALMINLLHIVSEIIQYDSILNSLERTENVWQQGKAGYLLMQNPDVIVF